MAKVVQGDMTKAATANAWRFESKSGIVHEIADETLEDAISFILHFYADQPDTFTVTPIVIEYRK